MAVSPVTDLSTGKFETIIAETGSIKPKKTRRVVFCSGKVYYDLLEARQVQGIDDVALVRIEQIYPFPINDYAELLQQYAHADEIVWCQEEPKNQGAWYQIRHRLQEPLKDSQHLYYAGRASAAAPASGIFKVHLQQQQALVAAALGIEIKASKSARPRKKKRT
jgi:2-oxoglutarate dehydrogenase E1 component